MSTIPERVAEYVREQGRESSGAVHISQVAAALGLSIPQVTSARSECTRRYDDIFPCAPGAMVWEDDWKRTHPEVWETAQARTRAMTGKSKAASNGKRKKAPPAPRQWRPKLPNIMGPVTSLYNVVAVNIHDGHVSVQHEDGTFTILKGTVTIETGGR